MAETETVEMIHEDALPGHESALEPKPEWEPRYPGSGRLQDKIALVTGADSGIGRAVAALFAREGADVAILYLCEHDDAAKTKEIVEAEGRRAIAIAGDLGDKIALVTGADSGIGRAVAALFAREGADVAILYLCEHDDAAKTREVVEAEGRRAIAIAGDLGDKDFCDRAVAEVVGKLGGIDILVNNAGEQHSDEDITDITEQQLKRTFQTNIYSMFFLTQAARPHLKKGAAIVNCTSITSYEGSKGLLDYSATKGAITAFTRSLSENLAGEGIRVNAVAPGPIWTPLNPCGGAPKDKIEDFGKDTPMGRPGQPNEVAPSFLFLACEDSSYMSGQVLHPNGGTIVGS